MMIRKGFLAIVLVAAIPACGKKAAAKFDKKTACDNIYKQYSSKQDPKVWNDACMAAPDENVRCVNLIMEEAKDASCKKLVGSAERTKLVVVLNGKPGDAAGAGSADAAGSAAAGSADAAGSAAGSAAAGSGDAGSAAAGSAAAGSGSAAGSAATP